MINATWHKRHRMPRNPTPEERLQWHLAHAKACGCRRLSAAMLQELRRRAGKQASKKSRAG